MQPPEARPGAEKTPRWSAERRPRSPKEDAARRRLVCRSALHPLGLCRGAKWKAPRWGRDYGVPGAANNTGDFAWLFENWIIERAERAANALLPSPLVGEGGSRGSASRVRGQCLT
jgi:hypothetical protein